MSVEHQITDHYSKKGTDEVSINNQHLHIGGAKATEFVLNKITLKPDMKVLDIGCGVGGPAIFAAEKYGCHVTGIDLTPDFIQIANNRTKENNLSRLLDFQVANVNHLQFKDESFDAAFMFHTGMNIPYKQEAYNETARVLKPQGTFLIYDILALDDIDHMVYPVPWAKTKDYSFVEPLDKISEYLQASGFEIEDTENCHDYAKTAVGKLLEQGQNDLSEGRRMIMENLKTNLDNGVLAPHIVIVSKL